MRQITATSLTVLILLAGSAPARADDVKFSTTLAPKFQVKGCTNCHEYQDRKLKGLAFGSHKGRTPNDCTDCHDSSTTGFKDEDEWFARPGLYTSAMSAKVACETIKSATQMQFKSKTLAMRQLEKHLFEDPRVLWAIEGATPQSGQLPEGKRETALVKGGLAEWKDQVTAWVRSGMKCD